MLENQGSLDPEMGSRDPFLSRIKQRFLSLKLGKMLSNNRGIVGDPPPTDPPPTDPPPTDPPPTDPPPTDPPPAGQWRTDHLDIDLREHPSLAVYKNVNELGKAHINAQKLIGAEKIPIPPKDATFESPEFQAVFDKLGRPSDHKAYNIPTVENTPEGAPKPTDEHIESFKVLAHSIGLLPQQVEALVKFNQEGANNEFKQTTDQIQKDFQSAETELRGKLGKSYDSNVQRAQQMIDKFGGADINKIIGDTGMGRNPKFIEFMMNIAKNFGENGELLGDPITSSIMSPEEALKEINKIKGDSNHAWHKGKHPEHKEAMKYMDSLFQMAYPEPANK